MQNIPKIKVGIVSVSRDCFPESLALNRISALVKAYEKKYGKGDIYQCPVCIVESEIHMKQALADIVNNGCNALCVYLGNFGPEISETMLAQQYAAQTGNPVMFCAAAEENISVLSSDRGDAYCGMLNASYNLKLRNVKTYIPEYPVGDADYCAELIHDFIPIARALVGIKNLKIISFGPRPQNFFACNAPIQQLYNLGVEIEENSELDLFEAFNKHAMINEFPRRLPIWKRNWEPEIRIRKFFPNLLSMNLPCRIGSSRIREVKSLWQLQANAGPLSRHNLDLCPVT